MEITWLGHACFRLKNRETTIVIDPFGAETGYNPRAIGEADVVIVSHDHPAHNNAGAVTGKPRVIQGPGEFEVGGVLITGVRTYHDGSKGTKLGRNTAYVVEMDEVRVCHLGDLGHIPTPDQAEALNGAEVLLVPVGGGTTLDAEAAAEVISLLEPRIVVPMHYQTPNATAKLDSLDAFCKQMGLAEPQPTARLNVTKTSLPLETTVTVLEYKR
ncbi:MAG TPA: MBL fold metallo-hydrolase [Dehalococcoidia bacterium]|nr:MBL fold metallo-hydrolase [Dehalococcoidia bacterium]